MCSDAKSKGSKEINKLDPRGNLNNMTMVLINNNQKACTMKETPIEYRQRGS